MIQRNTFFYICWWEIQSYNLITDRKTGICVDLLSFNRALKIVEYGVLLNRVDACHDDL